MLKSVFAYVLVCNSALLNWSALECRVGSILCFVITMDFSKINTSKKHVKLAKIYMKSAKIIRLMSQTT